MNQNDSSSQNNWTKFFLVLIILAVVGYQWYQNQQHEKDQTGAEVVASTDIADDNFSTVPPDRSVQTDSFLQPAGGRNLESPAGLIYTLGPGGEHRVDHVLRHAQDDLSRPVHGVFEGDRDAILRLIDEAYQKTKANSNQVQTEESDNNTVYTVDMGRRIGFEGGQRGQRNQNPGLTRVRLVLRDDRVITAYPYR